MRNIREQRKGDDQILKFNLREMKNFVKIQSTSPNSQNYRKTRLVSAEK